MPCLMYFPRAAAPRKVKGNLGYCNRRRSPKRIRRGVAETAVIATGLCVDFALAIAIMNNITVIKPIGSGVFRAPRKNLKTTKT